jgi:hypothetical protein
MSAQFKKLTLADVLSPHTTQEFVDVLRQCQTLHIPGSEGKYAELFDRPRFFQAIENAFKRQHNRGSFQLNAVIPDDIGEGLVTSQPIRMEQIEDALQAKALICVNDISIGDATLRHLVRQIETEIGLPGCARFNAYLSADGSNTAVHLDNRATNTLQISGVKRWRFSKRPAVKWPRCNAQLSADGRGIWVIPGVGQELWERLEKTDEAEFVEVTLKPGDFLSLPAGTWHGTETLQESIALNLSIRPLLLSEFLLSYLQYVFKGNDEWRSGLPPTADDADSIQYTEKYIKQQISTLQEYFTALGHNPENLIDHWKQWSGRNTGK